MVDKKVISETELSVAQSKLKAVIARIEQAVLEGGLFAMAMPRGSGSFWMIRLFFTIERVPEENVSVK